MSEPFSAQWFEFIKSPPRILFGVALFSLSILFAKRWNYLPPEGWEFWVAMLGLLSASLFISTALAALKAPASWIWHLVRDWQLKRTHADQFERDIPFFHDQEKKIYGWLLTNNRKWFEAAQDGGHAASLIGKGYVVFNVQHRQPVHPEDVPMIVPDHIWKVLEKCRSQFPKVLEDDGAHPWRVSWMAR